MATTQQFFILGHARTGSNYLLTLLGSHDQVKTHGELFNLDNIPLSSLNMVLKDPIEYLEGKLFSKASHKRAIGFKLFYDHMSWDYFEKSVLPVQTSKDLQEKIDTLQGYIKEVYKPEELDEAFRKFWNHIVSNKNFKIIHLKRKNKFNTLVSLKTAYLTNKWLNIKNKGSAKTRLHISPKACENFFLRLTAYEDNFTKILNKHDTLELFYEDLIQNKEKEMDQVFNFLDLASLPVSSILKKQITAPIPEVVENYSALKEHFTDTPWESFFESSIPTQVPSLKTSHDLNKQNI